MGVVFRSQSPLTHQGVVLRVVDIPIPGTGGGGGPTPSGEVLDATPILYTGGTGGTAPGYSEVAVRWNQIAAVTTENGSVTLSASLSQALPETVLIPVEASTPGVPNAGAAADVTIDPPYITFLAGQVTAEITILTNSITPLVGASYRDVSILLQPDDPIEIGGTQEHNAFNVLIRQSFGPWGLILRINDSAPPATPDWTWSGVMATGNPEIPDGFGLLRVPITLSSPAIDDVVFSIVITPGTAAAGLDYTLVTPTVTIPTGEQIAYAGILILEPAVSVPPTVKDCSVAATKTAGTAVLGTGGIGTWALEIVDDEVGVSPTIEWLTITGQAVEGGSPFILRGRIIGSPLTTEAYVPVAVSGDAVEGTDYLVGWAAQVGYARVPPGVNLFDVATVTAIGDGVAEDPEFAIFTLHDPPAGLLAGGDLVSTITIIDDGDTGTTEALVELGTGLAENMIQGLIAVNPPSPTLPQYACDGQRVQTVGHSRDGDDNWISAYVYAKVARDTRSVPLGTTPPLTIELASGEPDPAGAFIADIEPTYRCRPANTGADFERTGSGAVDGNWTGPTADAALGWPQVGADIVRETLHRYWLRRVGTSTSDVLVGAAAATDRCTMVEAVHKRIVGMDIILVSGIWHNGVVRDTDSPHAASDASAGNANILRFEASIPSGWEAVLVNAHPGEGFSGSTLTFFPDKGTDDYLFPSCLAYEFRYALIKTSGGNVNASQAQAYLRRKNIVTWIGSLGVDQNQIFGDYRDRQINLHRAGWNTSLSGSANPWRQCLDASSEMSAEAITAWTGGVAGLGFPLPRHSIIHGAHLFDPGESSGEGIDGAQAYTPSPGWWERADLFRMGCHVRHRLTHRDAITGRAGWWWNVAIDGAGAQAGLRVTPYQYGAIAKPGHARHPWHNSPSEPNIVPEGPTKASYMRAPTTRAWNTPEYGADPNAASVLGWQGFYMTHQSRVRNDVIDGWWGMRDPMARLLYESAASYATRCYNPVPMQRSSGTTGGNIVYRLDSTYITANMFGDWIDTVLAPSRQGIWRIPGNSGGENNPNPIERSFGGVERAIAWAATLVGGYYDTATTRERALIDGTSQTLEGGVSWINRVIFWLDHCMTEDGAIARFRGNTPGPYDPPYGVTNEATREGAWPDGLGRNWNLSYDGPNLATGYVGHMHWHFVRACGVLRRTRRTGSSQKAVLDRVFASPANILAAARNYTQGRWNAVWQYFYAVTIAGGGAPGADYAAVPTLAQMRAGAAWWHAVAGNVDEYYKMISAIVEAVNSTGDLTHLNVLPSIFDVPLWPAGDIVENGVLNQARALQVFEYLMRGLGGQSWNERTGGLGWLNVRAGYNGVQSFYTPLLALLQKLGIS